MVYPRVRVKAETCTFGNKYSLLHLPWGGCTGWKAANNKPTVDIYLGGHGMKKQGCPAPFLLDIFFQLCFSYRVFLLRSLTSKTPLTHDLAPRTTPINLSTHPFLCLPNTTAHPAIMADRARGGRGGDRGRGGGRGRGADAPRGGPARGGSFPPARGGRGGYGRGDSDRGGYGRGDSDRGGGRGGGRSAPFRGGPPRGGGGGGGFSGGRPPAQVYA